MRISVILATYNSPVWLEKVLWGYAVQTVVPDEVVVADDGSTAETLLTVERLKRTTRLRIRHVWHEDRGFRKCEILNRALVAATSDYLIVSDGDCIPRQDFVAVHQRFAAPNRFLSGGLVRLPMKLSELIGIDDITSGRAHSPAWLLRNGLKPNKKFLLMAAPATVRAAMDRLTPTRATWNGHNASGWKSDILHVNGFDERMGYGGEDRELGERLVNAGVRPLQIRHRAVCVHLDHSRGYVDAEMVRWNQLHRQRVRRERIAWTEYGVHQGAAVDDGRMILQFPSQDAQQVRRAA